MKCLRAELHGQAQRTRVIRNKKQRRLPTIFRLEAIVGLLSGKYKKIGDLLKD
jgi:hypothetical protein